MTADARGELFDRLEMLERLRPFQNTGWSPAKLSAAWEKAKAEAEVAIDAWLAEGTAP